MPKLVIIRREGETIVIDEKITITIEGHQGRAVRVSVEAPREVNVRRGELPARVEEVPQREGGLSAPAPRSAG